MEKMMGKLLFVGVDSAILSWIGKNCVNAAILIFACVVCFVGFLNGQSDQSVNRFTQADPNESGLVSMNVPLGGYTGRGIDLPVALSYSSDIWEIEHIGKVQRTVPGYGGWVLQSVTEAVYAENSAAGWRSSLGLPIIEFPKGNVMYDYQGRSTEVGGGCFGYRVREVYIHMPDGSTHTLRKNDQPSNNPSSVDKTGTFYAIDGTRMRFDANGSSDTGTIYMPDGTRYVLNHPTSQIIDRHGNTLTYDEGTRVWTDTLGRQISNPLPANPQVGEFEYFLPGLAGVNGGAQKFTFIWKTLSNSLTPDATGNPPALRAIGNIVLPNPYSAPGSSNYPFSQTTENPPLFQSTEYFHGEEGPETPALVVGKGQYGGQGTLFNPVVLAEIILPDGTKYKFSYNVFGEMDTVIYPTNSYDRYEYVQTTVLANPYDDWGIDQGPYGRALRSITSRKQSVDGTGSDIREWKYSVSQYLDGGGTTSIIAPDKTRTVITRHGPGPKIASYSGPAGQTIVMVYPFGFRDARAGMVANKKFYSSSADGLGGELLRQEVNQYEQSTFNYSITCQLGQSNVTKTYALSRTPRLTRITNFIFEGTGSVLAQSTTFGYDFANQFTTGIDQIQAKTYHYVVVDANQVPQEGDLTSIPLGTLAKTTETVYSSNLTYQSANILGLPISVETKDGANVVVSRSEMSYDDSGYVLSGSTNALPTTMRTWDSTKGAVTTPNAYLVTHAAFDQWGNRTIATDAKGYQTTTTYDPTHHAYPISVTSPVPDSSGDHASNSAFTTSTNYDVVTGLVLSTTDANGQMTEMQYNDLLLRPTKVIAPNGHQTITEYGLGTDAASRWVKVKTQIDSSTWSEAKTFYDGLGRTYKTQKIDSGGDVFTVTEYDIMGRVKGTSNPFRNVANPSCDTNLECTRPEYDDLSRTRKITSSDTDDVLISYGLSTSGVIGTTKTITDQAGRKRKGITDALGNMVQVIEDPDGSALVTDYVFDTLGNLRKTTQVEQTASGPVTQNRFFHYDSLGRLLRAKQPEQDTNSELALTSADPVTNNNNWSVKYTYDDNGNIETTTDARDITITAAYDRLNRIKTRVYDDGSTPAVSFYYDGKYVDTNDVAQTATGSAKGKTTGVKSSVSRTNYIDFDDMGRLEKSQQITDGQTYGFEYAYNLSGALIEESYPSGRKVQNVLDADGNLEMVKSRKNASSGYWAYANNFTYDASGAVTKMQLGNGLWETASYDEERLQVEMLGLGTTETTQNLLKLEFKYTGPTTAIGDKNNGSMREQKITVPAVGSNPTFTAVQTYTYDSFNRIHDAEEKISGTTKWKQTFRYDRFGNRRFDTTNVGDTTTLGSCAADICNPDINTSDNRVSSSQGYEYDANGNLEENAQNQRFRYDAESRQRELYYSTNSGSTPDAIYEYDGEGRRVKKVVGSEVTVFVYNAIGQLAAEYSTTIESPTTAKVSYLTTDHLGSPRITTDKNGAVLSRKDFTAFGEEVSSTERTSGTSGNGYNAPNIRQDYTGYQQDGESGLEFAQARYYNARHGRFSSVDPLTASASIGNPQTFNRYTYVLNSPYKFTDPLGLMTRGPNPDSGIFLTTDSVLPGILDRVWAHLFKKSQTPPATQSQQKNVNVTRTDKTYSVSGSDPAAAMRAADASKVKMEKENICDKGKAGCTLVEMTNSVGYPGTGDPKKVKGGYEITENPFSPTIDVDITVYVPSWDGYNDASQAQKDDWDRRVAELKDHEEGHVEIAIQEANKTGKLLAQALPRSRTFISRGNTTASINASVSRRYEKANQAVAAGYKAWQARDDNYDVLTKGGRVPRSQVQY